jgi:MFS transporter, DHA2 family, multidrug resistance protein
MSAAPILPREMAAETRPNPWIIAATVSLAAFMEVLDTSIANVALPHIAGGLAASVDDATWVLTSYLVSNAVVLPISGWLSNVLGRKRFYMTCVAIFTITSFLCGIAPSLGMLIFFRVLQGAGGGGLQPVSQAILADTFPPVQLGMAFAVYGIAVVLAPAVGPTLGGYITDNFNWRWIFFINVPVGILSLALTSRLVRDPEYIKRKVREAGKNLRIDYIGISLLALGLGALQVVLDKGQEDDWFYSHFIATLAVATALSLILFVVWELLHKQPVMDVRLLRIPSFAAANLLIFMFGFELYATTVLIPQYLQGFMGYTAELAGMTLSPGALLLVALMPAVGKLVRRVQARWLIGIGFLLSALALYHMTNLDTQIDFTTATMYRVYQNIGLALIFVPINTAAYVGIPEEKGGEVSGTLNLFRNIGGSVGISLVETMIARRAQLHQDRLISHVTRYHQNLRNLTAVLGPTLMHRGLSAPGALRQTYARLYDALITQATVQGYMDALWMIAIICFAMVPMVLMLKKNDPRQARVRAE